HRPWPTMLAGARTTTAFWRKVGSARDKEVRARTPRYIGGPNRRPIVDITYSITSSARASTDGGTARPRVFADLMFISILNFVGREGGRSRGFSPLRMRST